MKIINILLEESLLLESGVRIPKGTKSVKILHHDDFDGVMSAIAIALQLKKQGISTEKITTEILHDKDDEYVQQKKLAKRKNQMLVVVDFDRFKNQDAKKAIDFQTDHHEANDASIKNSSSMSVGKTQYGSDVLHISTTKAQGFIDGTDLSIMNGIDSAKFAGNITTNITLQRELKKNDGVKNKKIRLAIITSSLLGQLVRSSGSVNPGAIKSIIKNMIESPSLLRFYTEVKKHINLQKEQVELLKAYEGNSSGEIDWEAIKKYNEKAPKEMRIAITKYGTIRKSKETGRSDAASEEELSKRNIEGQTKRDLEYNPETGKYSLKSKDEEDAKLKPWELKDKYHPIFKQEKDKLWKKAEEEAMLRYKANWYKLSQEEKKEKIVKIWKALMDNIQSKDAPKILKKTENISIQVDFKGNRYLAYEDEKIAANIRDFWKFFQMALRPDFYEKYINAAKKYNIDFKPEEINLVELGKEALQEAKRKMFTITELKNRNFDNPEKVLSILNKAFDVSLYKSGGHKAITNIDLSPIYNITADKYYDMARRAKELVKNSKNEEAVNKFKEIEAKMSAKSKAFSIFINDFKELVQTILANKVQNKIKEISSKLKAELNKNKTQQVKESLKESIVKNVYI